MMYNSGLADHNSYMILRTYKNENLRISHNNRSCKNCSVSRVQISIQVPLWENMKQI